MSDVVNKFKIDYSYPDTDDVEFQKKIYEKKEFYTNKIPDRPNVDKYQDVKEFRDRICSREFSLSEHQNFLSNYINPNTPYRGALIFHGTGTGKSCLAIAAAEKFIDIIIKYNTKIYILVNGPLHRENWYDELMTCTGEKYKVYDDKTTLKSDDYEAHVKKIAFNNIKQYYKIITYRGFYRRVLGEKIIEKQVVGDKLKIVYRKTNEGEYERDTSVDKIYNLNNTLLIVDEAHNLTGNDYGEAVKKIMKESINLKILLLTATPMKNLADDIIELINYIRPPNDPLVRDKIFNNHYNHEMDFKSGGKEYLAKMVSGYVSHLRGADPVTYAKRIDKGELLKKTISTRVTRCIMNQFQENVYMSISKEEHEDTLDRKTSAISNFVIPGLSKDHKELIGYYGNEGLSIVMNQLKLYKPKLNKLIADYLGKTTDDEYIYLSEYNKTITGDILKFPTIKHFSIKFYRAFKKLNRLFAGRKGAKTAFVYSNLVKVGIELFQETLIQNGYLEFQENQKNYQITKNTICYYCGHTYEQHLSELIHRYKKHEDSSTEYETIDIPKHTFYPATFLVITGEKEGESMEIMPQSKKEILNKYYSVIENVEGRYIKLLLGSQKLSEGINTKNTGEVHLLDVHYNLERVDQVIGRAIRWCSHYKQMTEKNPYPFINVYKYVASLKDNTMSSDEDLYFKAERKYLLVKKVERLLKINAIDCPLNRAGNIFIEEVEKHKHCGEKGNEPCPAICDYTNCDFVCADKALNLKYYDKNKSIYKKITKEQLDTTTFTNSLARTEINYAKGKIKELYKLKFVYELKNIIEYVKSSYKGENRELFDEFFVYKALDELLPVNENDFNNFKDTILDKFNRPGYLIFKNKYYIYQPFNQHENVPMYYRTVYDFPSSKKLSLFTYMKKNSKYDIDIKDDIIEEINEYDFESTTEYYENRDENSIVGIIDKGKEEDLFKIRPKRGKILDKTRGFGIPSFKGGVCVYKDKPYITKLIKKLGIDNKSSSRFDLCNSIKDHLLLLEKYNTEKKTYVMIPKNHPIYKFPYNVHERVEYIKDLLNKKSILKLTFITHKEGTTNNVKYKLELTYIRGLDEYEDLIKELGGILDGDKFIFLIE